MRTDPLGRADPADRFRQAMANIRLEGLKPSPKVAELALAMAEKRISPEAAIEQLHHWYASRA
ncbi:MAG: antitoxin VbhA family protein [Chromatiales bacterium]|nr:antitoxin VbhA family protein [Gammaproteobacteria bacterium]MBW6477074.1 antitoxin VbhA family protein [Chromatiales bacterium]